jgi:hypothetical protein
MLGTEAGALAADKKANKTRGAMNPPPPPTLTASGNTQVSRPLSNLLKVKYYVVQNCTDRAQDGQGFRAKAMARSCLPFILQPSGSLSEAGFEICMFFDSEIRNSVLRN